MLKKYITALICLLCFFAKAQQTTRYNQYLLSNYLNNPAYAGTYNKWEIMAGRHSQWLGFEYAPVSTFASTTYTYRPNFSYKGWHGFGAYFEEDKRGLFTSKSVYASYAYHVRLTKGYNMGLGLAIGGKSEGLSNSAYSSTDPALQVSKKNILLYPDVVPGFRLYSKKMFLDLSVKQLYKNNLTQGNKKIGTDSKLIPTIYFTYGRRFRSSANDFIITPSTHIQWAVTGRPLIDLSIMSFYRNRVGVGATYTINNSLTCNLQVQIAKNIVFGIAYNYATSGLANAAANSAEVILGFSPVMSSDGENAGRRRVAKCPDFDY